MIFRSSEIPDNYNKIAEINNNYVVWVRESQLEYGSYYNAYYQFFKPSFNLYFTEFYKIKTIDSFIAHYSNNGVYSYIDYYESEGSLKTMSLISGEDYTTSENFRSDYDSFFIIGFFVCFIIVWVFSNISRLFFKGGLR